MARPFKEFTMTQSGQAAPLVQLGRNQARAGAPARPSWLKVTAQDTTTFSQVRGLISDLKLNTVCEEARCPNIWECWGQHQTATFMILGDVCTRNCRYCSVKSGRPTEGPDPTEPERVAQAAVRLGLTHVVLTSVDRDDLPDFGAGHFVATLAAIKKVLPTARIEVLIPDFAGDKAALESVLEARPDILDHNTETVPRLFRKYRSRGVYDVTLEVLERAHHWRAKKKLPLRTKTGIMLGLGEEVGELLAVMDDLRRVHCDVLTLGQYLSPTRKHAPIVRYWSPEEFAHLKQEALSRGFLHCEAGPLVRSSYHAHEHMPAS
jgi:lipoic acid synthetase